MRFVCSHLLILITLVSLCCITPVMGADNPEEVYFYDIYAADVNGASVYFDSEYMGTISNGGLIVRVISDKTRPYYRVRLTKDGYRDAVATLPEPAGDLQHVSVFLTMEPASSRTGTISLSSSPSGAHYLLDEEREGGTPDTLSDIPAGTHTITITRDGYKPWTDIITVVAGNTTEVFAPLEKERAFGTLSLKSVPAGAEIYIDRWQYGTTPLTIGGIAAGAHTVELKKDGFADATIAVTVIENTETPVTYTLKQSDGLSGAPGRGTLILSSSPAGAMVYVDETPRGMTPVTVTGLSVGVHQVRLTNTGHEDYRDSVRLSEGETRTVSVAMQPLPASEFAPLSVITLIGSLAAAALPAVCALRKKCR